MKRYPFPPNKVLVCGHRGEGCSGLENTMHAFRHALELGVDMIETDVHMTRDGQLILMHDDMLERTTNGTGRIRERTWQEIRQLDATIHGINSVSPEPPPLLSQLLELVQAYPNVLLNIELKDDPSEDEAFAFECADKTCRMLLNYAVAERTWINSFSGRLLEYVHGKYGELFYYHGFYPWFILGEMTTDPETFIDVACMQHRFLDQNGQVVKYDEPLCPWEWFDHLREKGIMPLLAPSLREESKYDLAVSWGAGIICHDNPGAMLAHLREKGLHEESHAGKRSGI